MRVRMFVPLTLENVGSEGKFFTDKAVLKTGCAFIAGIYVGLVVYGQLGLFLPSIITVPLGVIVSLYITILIMRYWVLLERLLLKLFDKMDKHKVVDASDFCDKPTLTANGVCLHESGHVSVLVEIYLGTTIGINEEEINSIYRCFEMFESRLLLAGTTFKTYGIEYVRKTFEELDEQQVRLSKSSIPNISNTMLVRGKYIRAYTQEAGRMDKVVYSIATDKSDADTLRNLITRLEPLFRHPNIFSFDILDSYEKINKFGEEFFGVKYFDMSSDSDDDLIDVLKFEEV